MLVDQVHKRSARSALACVYESTKITRCHGEVAQQLCDRENAAIKTATIDATPIRPILSRASPRSQIPRHDCPDHTTAGDAPIRFNLDPIPHLRESICVARPHGSASVRLACRSVRPSRIKLPI
jgi:hypothetical protein